MTFYNMIHGQNPAADWLLGLLDLTREDVGRFRDAWVEKDGGEIHVYTRNGGGNRDCIFVEAPDSEDCACYGCAITYRLPKHPLYLRDRDDDFDCTYATVVFRAPESAVPLLKDLAQKRDPDEEWTKALRALQEGKRPDVVERMAPMLTAITAALESKS